MTAGSRVTMPTSVALLLTAAMLLAGAGLTYVAMRRYERTGPEVGMPAERAEPPRSSMSAPGSGAAARNAPLPDAVVSLTPEAVERAGIGVATVESGIARSSIRLPGIVQPNAYRRVTVTPLVAGRVTRMSVELGASVRRGQTLAQIYSPELAEAQTKYVSARAMLDAHDRELRRTEKLVEIGAASRQELERIHAEHAAQSAAVESARSQLELLGVTPSTIDTLAADRNVDATITIPAPIDGIVTERTANVGLNVTPATTLYTIVDLATVWVVADVYEKDFSRVRAGSDATVTAVAYAGLSLRGRVSYIDPQVDSATRTAKARVEVPNPRGELRLGMFADVVVTGAQDTSGPMVPHGAVQKVGDRTVVYLLNPEVPGTFTEREVRLGEPAGDQVAVLSGVQPGDTVVADGSFFVRAERERLGSRKTTIPGSAPTPSAARERSGSSVRILVTERGFEPARIPVRAGRPTRLTFVRTTDKTCATEVVFPSLKLTRELPLNSPVVVEIAPRGPGEIAFACGMDMVTGAVAVE